MCISYQGNILPDGDNFFDTTAGVILAHNHPSGNLQPSEADLKITKKIKEARTFLDIKVLNHPVLSEVGYLSMADGDMMP